MHAAVEHLAKATEALQTAANSGIFLEYGDPEAFLGQEGTSEQSAKTASDNDC